MLLLWEWKGSGGSLGLQNRCGASFLVPGGFDSHALPPIAWSSQKDESEVRKYGSADSFKLIVFCLLVVR